MRILGIETSCDDTGVAIYDDIDGLIFNKVINQSKIHSRYGGVVPELAARQHNKNITLLLQDALKKVRYNSKYNLDAIAYTAGPGLISSLIVGATIASSLAFSINVPIILVNHMEAHLLSYMLNRKSINFPKFPFLGLLVSGGHTQLIISENKGEYKILGNTLDDSVGDTIDKIAQLLGINYPGGKNLSELAKQGTSGKFVFPRPMIHHKGFNFSFSGLKTYVTRIIKKHNDYSLLFRADIAKEFEETIVDTLLIKCKKALKLKKIKRLIIAGGVSANHLLRYKFKKMMSTIQNHELFLADINFCTDNAAMIALTGMLRFKGGNFLEPKIVIKPSWIISDLCKF
ncbi:tRNA N6-adenosine threonylcarbamoyltransferase [Buchnera aphidicola (Nipponaphis monzeni)]|uniref:tRNA N6-adenosine threonylcarbamoyltransferase n=1 Tax=Buchnera aphidicola (Nipponaphis monzeni) TaxID=2495405 RepID=A0A455T9R1_9GAMM|nr:tRNA (adenosine(37)-N6)-threonylcarbamoyltransferase complex transferase subunit TsaD [Buchnera aphidicola]BBI01064.1 tRNA N6-adenosine threonylcarbamoyltransferase [Buchnera aphidicola (Nipponaphis monzeni)]